MIEAIALIVACSLIFTEILLTIKISQLKRSIDRSNQDLISALRGGMAVTIINGLATAAGMSQVVSSVRELAQTRPQTPAPPPPQG